MFPHMSSVKCTSSINMRFYAYNKCDTSCVCDNQVRSRGLPDDHAGPIRIVDIEGVDANMCCGTHVSNLSHLQVQDHKRMQTHKHFRLLLNMWKYNPLNPLYTHNLFIIFVRLSVPQIIGFIWILGDKAAGNRERKEKHNQPDLPGRLQSVEVCREKLQHRAIACVSAQVSSKPLSPHHHKCGFCFLIKF